MRGLLVRRRRRWLVVELAERESDPGCGRRHEARAARIKRSESAKDGKHSSGAVYADGVGGMRGRDELGDAEEEERQEKEAEDDEDGNVGAQRGDEEDERQEAPQDEKDAQCKRVRALVAGVRLLDAERGHEKHGKGEPEGAIGAVDRGTKGVADAELHDAGDELGSAAEEDGEAEDGLVRTDIAERI